jgi:hypothetical protein
MASPTPVGRDLRWPFPNDARAVFVALVALLAGGLACLPNSGTTTPTPGSGGTGASAGTTGTAGTTASGRGGAAGGAAGATGGSGTGVAGAGTAGASASGTAGTSASGSAGTGAGGGTAGSTGTAGAGGRGGGTAGTTGTAGTSAAGAGGSSMVSVLTNRYDNVRNGANTAETTLTVSAVGGGKFGLLYSRMVDGHVYAQPLYMAGLTIGGAKHNVLFVETEHDTVFAFDADDASASTPLWMKSLGTPMRTYPGTENQPVVTPFTVSCRDMYPETGITSTPVIDPATNRMYVVAKNFEGNVYHQRLHALDVTTGNEVSGSPVEITGSVPGTGEGGNGTTVTFDPYHHLNRTGLLLFGGNVFIAYASHCDDDPYHGWLFAYSASTLAQTGIFNTTPNGQWGGIWQSGMGLVTDGTDIYFCAGNGDFDAAGKGAQLGLSVARVHLGASGFSLVDWFTPNNAASMNTNDYDYTTAAVLLPNPKVIVMGGKDGNINVLDPTNLGKFSSSSNNVLQQFSVGGHTHGSPVYWNGPSGPTVYLWPESANLRAYHFNGNKITTTAVTQYTGATPTHPGGTLSLSANGATAGSGVLWATFTSTKIDTTSGHMGDAWHYVVPGVLYAFDAANLATPIWMSTTNKARDDLGNLAKFNAPVVANGKVFVASQVAPASDVATTAGGKIQAYGLLP